MIIRLCSCWFLFCLLPAIVNAQPAPRPRKLIATGYDMPTTAQLRRDLAAMEDLPFDGTTVWLTPQGPISFDNGTPPRLAFSRQHWERGWFRPAIDDLNAVKSAKTRLTDNFILMSANPGDVDWFDDAGWKEIVDHFRIAAWVAQAGGAKGICFDPEPYTPPFRPFDFKSRAESSRHTFDEYLVQARQRGREMMQAMTEEYPDITILTYFMNSYLVSPTAGAGPIVTGRNSADQKRALFLHSYGLYSSFIDGWLDVLPPNATLVDGNENGYGFSTEANFQKSVMQIKSDALDLVSPENRAKYRSQVHAGVAIYMDAHVPVAKNPYELQNAGANLLQQNVSTALKTVDEYVWLYGEYGRWWPEAKETKEWPGAKTLPAWETLLPGATTALHAAKDPEGTIERSARAEFVAQWKSGKADNLIVNGDFSAGPVKRPPGATPDPTIDGVPVQWNLWFDEFSGNGHCAWDETLQAVLVAHARRGVIQQTIPVKHGERLYVSARSRTAGNGLPILSLAWKDANEKWLWDKPRKVVIAPWKDPESDDSWSEWGTLIEVPGGVGLLAVQLGIEGQTSESDIIWWDDIQVTRLLPNVR